MYLLFLVSAFDPSQKRLLPSISNSRNINNATIFRHELKALKTEASLKRKEMNILVINEDGLRRNIKHLEDIIEIKVIMYNHYFIYVINYRFI